MAIRRRGALARRHPGRRVAAPEPPLSAFEALVERALDELPPDLRGLLTTVAIEGTPVVEYAADQVPFPNKVTLFRRPLEEDFPDLDELAHEVRQTVMHELAHHAGFDDRRLRELGYD
jgi:predicted Zn-dependent protease with MMP-like domain